MANFVSILRCLLALGVIPLVYVHTTFSVGAAFILTILVICMDGLDGYLARKFNESSKFGAMLDIMADRIVENVYWLMFLAFGWIHIFLPLVVIIRGIVVDSIRSLAFEKGLTAFGKTSMMETELGKFLVSSNISRASYAVSKGFAFSLMIGIHIPGWELVFFKSEIIYLTYILIYATVILCVIRGLPVLVEGKRFLKA